MSLLTILQGPLDVACALTHCVKVSIQSGYEEQCFWDSHSTAFQALRTEMPSLESRARVGDEPPWPRPSQAAQHAAAADCGEEPQGPFLSPVRQDWEGKEFISLHQHIKSACSSSSTCTGHPQNCIC